MKLEPGSDSKMLDAILAGRRPSKFTEAASAANHPGVDRCLGFMAQNFHEPIQLKDLVKVSGMSRRGLHKAFNRCLGVNPGAVLCHVRIKHAKRLLVEDDLMLRQIAKLCGYRSVNSFCVAFQRTVGMAPKKFQRLTWLGICQNSRQPEVLNNQSLQFHRDPSRLSTFSRVLA